VEDRRRTNAALASDSIVLTSAFDDLALPAIAGSANVGGTPISAEFDVQQGPSAAVKVVARYDAIPTPTIEQTTSLTGSTPGYNIEIADAFITNITSDLLACKVVLTGQPHDVVFKRKTARRPGALKATFVLQGCAYFFSGVATTWFATFGGRAWTLALRDRFFEVEKLLKANAHGLLSCSFSCDVIDDADVAAAEAEIHNVCDLLTYATDVCVRLGRVVVDDGDPNGPCFVKLTHHKPPGHPVLPVIPLSHEYDGGVKKLLDHAADRLKSIRGVYLLNSVMSLARLARHESAVTVKALLAANALEVLRFNFGHQVLVPSGKAQANGDDLHWPPGVNKGKRMTFREVLTEMAGAHLLTGWQAEAQRFTDLRNAVVHQGEVPGAGLMDKYKEAIDALHYVDTVILALLDWDTVGGRYLPCNASQDPNTHWNNIKAFTR
jgi:hypothetical protein